MLMHLVPRLFNRFGDVKIDLLDISIPDINLKLLADKDIVARTPYPNKCYYVACKKTGRKAVNGILVDFEKPVDKFSVVTNWLISTRNKQLKQVQHIVNYTVLDRDFNYATDDPTIWYASYNSVFKNRWPEKYEHLPPIDLHPNMKVFTCDYEPNRGDDIVNHIEDGVIIKRIENYDIPTVEQARLFGNNIRLHGNRMPVVEHAFTSRAMEIV